MSSHVPYTGVLGSSLQPTQPPPSISRNCSDFPPRSRHALWVLRLHAQLADIARPHRRKCDAAPAARAPAGACMQRGGFIVDYYLDRRCMVVSAYAHIAQFIVPAWAWEGAPAVREAPSRLRS